MEGTGWTRRLSSPVVNSGEEKQRHMSHTVWATVTHSVEMEVHIHPTPVRPWSEEGVDLGSVRPPRRRLLGRHGNERGSRRARGDKHAVLECGSRGSGH